MGTAVRDELIGREINIGDLPTPETSDLEIYKCYLVFLSNDASRLG